jgi:hypothetical protein
VHHTQTHTQAKGGTRSRDSPCRVIFFLNIYISKPQKSHLA